MPMQRNLKPRFEVHPVNRMVRETRFRRSEDGINESYEVEVPYGYDVYFPAGHSIRVSTDAELQRLGFMEPPDLVDMDSGESVGQAQPVSLRQAVQRRVRATRKADIVDTPRASQVDFQEYLPQGDSDA